MPRRKDTKLERNKNDDKIIELVAAGDAAKLRPLIQKKKFSSLKSQDRNGRVAIYEACRLGFEDCAEIILSAEPEANFPDESGRNPLHIAAVNGHVECVKVLCSKSQIPLDAVDHRGQTAAMHAAIAGSVEVLTFLLARGADSEKADADGNTCLLLAIRADKRNTATALLNASVYVNAANRQQKTALMFACEHGAHELVNMLLERGADANMRDTGGRTALSYAKLGDHTKCEELLPADADLGSTTMPEPVITASEEVAASHPPPSSRTSTSFTHLQEQVEHLTADLYKEQQKNAQLEDQVERLQAELSAFQTDDADITVGNISVDMGYDPSSPANVPVEEEVAMLKKQIGNLMKAKQKADADNSELRKELVEAQANAQDTSFDFGSSGGMIPASLFQHVKEQSEQKIAQLEAQLAAGDAPVQATNGSAKNLDHVSEDMIELYRHHLMLAVKGELPEEVKASILALAEETA
eukprot:TRINITY_DN7108_c0_g2_i1.p1 TRINITY_DN7108_c0_g2~~TRINITY_DN7108_c0_g2_i1.p1  ORF type:complete len:470 (+),score=137.59 TRINITY_DN7108_c0_g2_i1:90-1499(+)